MRLETCRDYHTCDSSCLQDQREWCKKQEKFMNEPDKKKRDELIWDFIVSLQCLMRNLARKLTRKYRNMETEDLVNHMNSLLFHRFKKTCDSGIFYKRTKLKGYLNRCLRGEAVRLRQINGQDLSLDEILEKQYKSD